MRRITRRLAGVLTAVLMTLTIGVATAAPSQAACGMMDHARDPSTYVTIHWKTGSSYTKVYPQSGTANYRAVLGRYSGEVSCDTTTAAG